MQHIRTLLDNVLANNFHCSNEGINMAIESLKNISDISALQSNLKVSNGQTKNKNNIHDKLFDDECKNTREKLTNMSNQKHRNPNNNNICLHYYETLKQCKNTIRTKGDQHVRNQINQIEESIKFLRQLEHTYQTKWEESSI